MPILRSRPICTLAAALVALLAGGAAAAPPAAPPPAAVPPAGARPVVAPPPVAPSPVAPPPAAPSMPAPPGFAALAARLLPAVVNIAASTVSAPAQADRMGDGATFDRHFRDFMRGTLPDTAPAPRGTQSLGSGFIVDSTGLIVTNNHVIAGAQRIAVTLQDGSVLAARVVGRDQAGDLALLRVDAGHPLPVVQWGDSDAARIGDWVVAIGNPFGLGGTVTAGIVSGRGRDIHDGPYDDFIQTDAPINRGNSGGPLFDLAGRVIGVNTAIYSPSGGSVGIGFAIPSNTVRTDIDQLRRYGHPRRGWLGLQAEPVTADIAHSLGLPGAGGALVASVTPGGPAAAAGLKAGDVILRFAGARLRAHTLPRRVAQAPPGTEVTLLVWRDGQQLTLHTQLGALPEMPPRPAAARKGATRAATPAVHVLHTVPR